MLLSIGFVYCSWESTLKILNSIGTKAERNNTKQKQRYNSKPNETHSQKIERKREKPRGNSRSPGHDILIKRHLAPIFDYWVWQLGSPLWENKISWVTSLKVVTVDSWLKGHKVRLPVTSTRIFPKTSKQTKYNTSCFPWDKLLDKTDSLFYQV